jgi:hypothetical protein
MAPKGISEENEVNMAAGRAICASFVISITISVFEA